MTTQTQPVVIVGGGQSGLAAARAVRDAGLRPVVLEAGDHAAGGWPGYYDSLTLFSPARFSAMPDLPFPGDPDSYPGRDEVAAYLRRYADHLDVEIRTGTRAVSVDAGERGGFVVRTVNGDGIEAGGIEAGGVVAASGTFTNPHLPVIPGQETFAGELMHVAAYRSPKDYTGKRVVVVGGGNSVVQVGYELADVASTTLASRAPIQFLPQQVDGQDLHHWLTTTGFDHLPLEWLARVVPGTLVVDTGDYRRSLESGRLDRRPMFTGFDGDGVVWADGVREKVDTVIFATGYRPSLDYLEPLGALNDGMPVHSGGISSTHPGLVYLGLEFQRSFSSNTLRGVHRDAEYVTRPLAAQVRGAHTAVGL